jgi:hypothetical protein
MNKSPYKFLVIAEAKDERNHTDKCVIFLTHSAAAQSAQGYTNCGWYKRVTYHRIGAMIGGYEAT